MVEITLNYARAQSWHILLQNLGQVHFAGGQITSATKQKDPPPPPTQTQYSLFHLSTISSPSTFIHPVHLSESTHTPFTLAISLTFAMSSLHFFIKLTQ